MVLTNMQWREDTIHSEPVWCVDPDISVVEVISCHHLFPQVDIVERVSYLLLD